MQSHHESALVGGIISRRRVGICRPGVIAFGITEIAVEVIAVPDTIQRIGIFCLVAVGLGGDVPLKSSHCLSVLLLFKKGVAEVVPAKGVILIGRGCALGELPEIACRVHVVAHPVIRFTPPVVGIIACFDIVAACTYAVVEMLYSLIHVPVDELLCPQLEEHHLFRFEDASSRVVDTVDGTQGCIIIFGCQECLGQDVIYLVGIL